MTTKPFSIHIKHGYTSIGTPPGSVLITLTMDTGNKIKQTDVAMLKDDEQSILIGIQELINQAWHDAKED